MEPITIDFKTLKRTLDKITISPGKIYVDYNDIIDLDDPIAQQVFDMQYNEPDIVEAEDYVINHRDHNGVCSNAFATEFQKVRSEFIENEKVLGINNLSDYLNSILEYYLDLESRIKENEDGSFSSDLVNFEECDADKVNNSLFKNSYNDFLAGLKRTLRDEIVFFNKHKVSDKLEIPAKSKAIGTMSQKQRYKSLKLIVENKSESEVLHDFHKALKDYGLIEFVDYKHFKKVFIDEEITQKIDWIGDPNELFYLIKALRAKKLLQPQKGFWQLTCNCFNLKDGSERVLTPDYLARCKDPSRKKRTEINSIIDILIH